jgi:serine/threonine-protein kinase PpkA
VLKLSRLTNPDRRKSPLDGAARSARAGSDSRPAPGPATSVPGNPTPASAAKIQVPGYRIERRLAQGSSAEVYLARGTQDSELVTLKIMKLQPNSDSLFLKRFMQEYSLLAKLTHPNVVRIHERGFGSEFAFIAMEYCPFGDLRGRIGAGLPPSTALDYLQQVAQALDAAHRLGIVHRDIKPANILFRSAEQPVLSDFGVAKDLESVALLTIEQSIIGSLYYVSPEQIARDQCDHRSDLYSMGIVLCQMVTGKPPFRGSTSNEVMQAHLNAPIPRLPPALAPLQSLLDGLLAKEPDDRFQSAEELLAGISWIADAQGWSQTSSNAAAS